MRTDGNKNRCILMNPPSYKWKSKACNLQYSFVCEYTGKFNVSLVTFIYLIKQYTGLYTPLFLSRNLLKKLIGIKDHVK